MRTAERHGSAGRGCGPFAGSRRGTGGLRRLRGVHAGRRGSRLGTTISVVTEPVNPKVKPKPPPKVIPICTYKGCKEGKPVEAKAHFRFGKTDAEAQKAFEEHRLQVQTKPLLISGTEAFWSDKTGQMNLRKGRTWVTLSVGPEKLSERDIDQAKALAELLVKKL